MFRHILPNTLGPIIVNGTLAVATAILTRRRCRSSASASSRRRPRSAPRRERPDEPAAVVADDLPGLDDRLDRAVRSTSSATGCATRSIRRRGEFVPEPILSIKNLVVEFKTDDGIVHAVDDITYDVFPGETLGIVGESGSGKSVSTLSILGLIPQPPGRIVSGTAMFKGKDLLKMKKQRAAHVPRRRARDDLPGSDDVAEPGAEDRLPARRGDQDALPEGVGQRGEEARGRPAAARRRAESRTVATTSTRTSSRAACDSAR